MASDAAKLAKEQPDVFAALLAETEPGVTGEDTPKKGGKLLLLHHIMSASAHHGYTNANHRSNRS